MTDIANKDIDEIKLTDLVEVKVLQKIQDEFSEMACMAALITDENGVPITEGSNFSVLCKEYCRKSKKGRKRCEQCDRMGAVTALEQGGPVYYYCHANLIDFAAPIMLNGRMIGSFIGGQVLPGKPDYEKMRRIAREIEVDEEAFLKAAADTTIVPTSAIDRSTKFIYGYAEVLSEMAYTTYLSKKMSEEALQAASAKTDFLANMSHEIRTPLNAIIGMAKIAMREEMSDEARKCMEQITSSGKILLAIINDILDYSKMGAGKLSLAGNEYETLALVQDVVSIIASRIGDKNIELIVDVDPSIPRFLYGDDIRVKQIMINLANNAVKFTHNGYVALRIGYSWISSDEISLKCKVEDTGIGIKKEAFGKLFASFEQVDSKRNREIEGTGLGLAIVKNLVELMGGTLSVESEYEKGSTFSFEIPQKVLDERECITPIEDCPCVIGLVSNPYLRPELKKNVERIGAQYVEAGSAGEIPSLHKKTEASFLFISENLLTEELIAYAQKQDTLTTVRIVPLNHSADEEIPGVLTIKNPLYSMNVAALLRNVHLEIASAAEDDEIDFIAPDACILVVDDNEVNLTVTTGLLKPLRMQMDTAESGMKAVTMISNKRYDLILMDHMMPEVDGVETTRIIRRLHPEYDDVPIIALSANAVRGMREMFLQEGMNDFVAKPIELKMLVSKLKKYLPQEKILPFAHSPGELSEKEESVSISIPGLDVAYSLKLLGSQELFWRVLTDYYRIVDHKYERIASLEAAENWKEYCTEVHALKSASRQIGALALSDKAEQLEFASSRADAAYIHQMTGDLLADYRRLASVLAPYCKQEEQAGTEQISPQMLNDLLTKICFALNNLDLGAMEDVIKEMKQYAYEEKDSAYLQRLEAAVENIDMEAVEQIINEWADKEL